MLRYAVIAAALLAAPAHAATITLNAEGRPTGATGITFGGGVYDVTFERQNCADFDGCPPDYMFDLPGLDAARAASFALSEQVFQGVHQNLNNVVGMEGDVAQLWTHFGYIDVSGTPWLHTAILEHESVLDTLPHEVSFAPIGPNRPTEFMTDEAVVRWTLVSGTPFVQPPSNVPIPASLPLLAVGLGVFGFLRRR